MFSPSLLDANFFDDRSRVCQYVQFFLYHFVLLSFKQVNSKGTILIIASDIYFNKTY